MAFVIADRVRETTTTIGTGSITLAGAYTSFQSFSAAIGNGNNTYYTIASASSGEWEVGIGTYSSGGNLLSRDTVLSSSNAGNLVNFSVGSKDVFVTQPASRAIFVQNAGTGLQTGTTAFTANRVLYANATSTTTTSANLTFDGTTLTAANFADSSLTSGRVTYATTSGNLTDSANLTFDGSTLTANALTTTSTVTINGGTANGVAYLNGSKVLTTGSALTFDGSKLLVGSNTAGYGTLNVARDTTTPYASLTVTDEANAANTVGIYLRQSGASAAGISTAGAPLAFYLGGAGTSEAMRLTSTGLGIGTSSPGQKLDVNGDARVGNATAGTNRVLQINGVVNKASRIAFQESGTDRWLIGNGAASENGNFEIYDATNGNNFVLTRTGNLGLGVTPSAWTSFTALQFGETGCVASNAFSSSNTQTFFGNNLYYDGAYRYIATGSAATQYIQLGSEHRWNIAASGTAGNAITFTQAMTLDASGNLLVGTTSALTSASGRGNVTINGTDAVLAFGNSNSSAGYVYAASTNLEISAASTRYINFLTNGSERARITSGGDLLVGTTTSSGDRIYVSGYVRATSGFKLDGSTYIDAPASETMRFVTFGSERARITSGGNLLVGTTSFSFSSNGVQIGADGRVWNTSNIDYNFELAGSTGNRIRFYTSAGGSGATVGSITVSTTATAYNTSSDYRLKDNAQPLTGSGAFIDALQPKTWDWKDGGGKGVGFIAHEVQEISPGSVVGAKDAVDAEGNPVMQAMEYGSAEFIANIVAELQSLRARVAQLESKGA